MSRLRWCLEGVSHHTTVWIGTHLRKQMPMHFVCGYPRSGTTWFSEMLGDYLNLPRPSHYIFPIGFESVIQTHAEANSDLNDCFYIVRDGRDVLVSLFFYVMNKLQNKNIAGLKHVYRVFGSHFDPQDIESNFPKFVNLQFDRPLGTKSHWGTHTLSWLEKSEKHSEIVLVRYEALLQNTMEEMQRVLKEKCQEVDKVELEYAVMRNQFHNQMRRDKKQHRTFLRKGISGDWRRYFSLETAQIFDHFAGKSLIALCYEDNHNWIHSFQTHERTNSSK